MSRKIGRIFITLSGMALGVGVTAGIYRLLQVLNIVDLYERLVSTATLLIYIAAAVLGGIIFFILAPAIINSFLKLVHLIENRLSEMPLADVLAGVVGLILGLLIALLITSLLNTINIPWVQTVLAAAVYIFLAYLGWIIGIKRRKEISFSWFRRGTRGGKEAKNADISSKILDTNVIIDGRILDICKTGIMEGTLIIPSFVLNELRYIADSSDALKRNRGRRGLDVLHAMQKELSIPVVVEERDFEDLDEVDSKLLRLAKEMGAVVVTNDYNLNKVAEVQQVRVLNINELANAVKPVVLPGEEMTVQVVKDGKESGQGIAYLDDGTMIVVEGGKHHMNEVMDVIVTSVLQTSAGRMIFAKTK